MERNRLTPVLFNCYGPSPNKLVEIHLKKLEYQSQMARRRVTSKMMMNTLDLAEEPILFLHLLQHFEEAHDVRMRRQSLQITIPMATVIYIYNIHIYIL